jgi:thiol-disulfide isomerase/thioredoxin
VHNAGDKVVATGLKRNPMMTLLATIFAGLLLASSPEIALGVTEGDPAPGFSLPRIDGSGQVALNSNTDGTLDNDRRKVIYLDFWASWCAPCRVSLPQIIKLQEDLGGDLFEVLAINVDEKTKDATRFLQRYPVNYTVLSDSAGTVAEKYALPGMPTSFVIDSTGVITMVHSGFKLGDLD